jgi:hypothetical protein
MMKMFSGNDLLLLIALTAVLGLLLDAVSTYVHIEVGLGALIAVLLVRVRALQREMAQLKVQLQEKQTNESVQTA